jgi:putative hemolysin
MVMRLSLAASPRLNRHAKKRLGLAPERAITYDLSQIRRQIGFAMTDLAPSAAPRAGVIPASRPANRHIVDVLIEERAPELSSSWFWPIVRPPLYAILNYAKARRMADAISVLGGQDAMRYLSRLLRLQVQVTRPERLTRPGAYLIIANHPTGITDGIALYDAIAPTRPDVLFYANSDAHRVCPRFDEALIPVEWVPEKRTRERTRVTLKMTAEAMADGRPIMIFPAGRLARLWQGQVTDPEWQSTAVGLARKYNVPIVPVHVSGPYATLFHFFNRFSKELRDITLFHELLNKEGKAYQLIAGPEITPDHVGAAGDSVSASRKVKHYIERVLSADPDAVFDPNGPECAFRDPPKPNVPGNAPPQTS